jgi:phosphatidylglycerophosphate synthase
MRNWARTGAQSQSAAPRKRLTAPNLLTSARLLMLPLLWILAAAGAERLLGLGIAVAASTDVLDGILARALRLRSEFGSRLDSIADHLLSASVLIWLVWLKPEFTSRFAHWLLAWAVLAMLTLWVGWRRFRKIGDLHLISAKAAMVLGYLFVSALFVFDSYRTLHLGIVLGAAFVGAGESLLVLLTRSDPHERIGSILLRPRRRREAGASSAKFD